VAYQPAHNLDLRLTWNRSSSEGDLSFNSKRNELGFTATYNMGERLTLSGTFSNSKMDFLGSTGGSSTDFMFFKVGAKPWRKLETNFGYQVMKSNSSGSTTGTTGTGGTSTIGGITAGYGNPYAGYGGYGSGVGSPYGGYGNGTPGFGFGYGSTNITSFNTRVA